MRGGKSAVQVQEREVLIQHQLAIARGDYGLAKSIIAANPDLTRKIDREEAHVNERFPRVTA